MQSSDGWLIHDDVIKWKHFPRYCPCVRGIHRWPVNSPHKGQWRGALMFSLICTWTDSWANNGDAGDLRRCHAHHDVIVMSFGMYLWSSGVPDTYMQITHMLSYPFLQICGICPQIKKKTKKKPSIHNISSYLYRIWYDNRINWLSMTYTIPNLLL